LALARAVRLETEGFIEGDKVVVGDDSNSIGDLSLPDAVDIRFHQSAANLLALVLRQYSQRVDSNGTAALLMADGLPIFKGPALVRPVLGKLHGTICHTGPRSTGSNDMSDERGAGLGLVTKDGQSKKTQAELRASGQAVDELIDIWLARRYSTSFSINDLQPITATAELIPCSFLGG
jgi:hypothetical protein